jgi:hypothetical protein
MKGRGANQWLPSLSFSAQLMEWGGTLLPKGKESPRALLRAAEKNRKLGKIKRMALLYQRKGIGVSKHTLGKIVLNNEKKALGPPTATTIHLRIKGYAKKAVRFTATRDVQYQRLCAKLDESGI